jgi:hypothetical protein
MGKAIPLPNGLRFIMGFNMASGKQVQGWGAPDFGCNGPVVNVNGLATMAEALKNCPAGHQLRMVLHAPECWDGKNLDSADHQSHLAHASFGDWGYLRCPSTHPYVIPAFELAASYSIAAGDDTSLWRLSSDAMHPELGQGGTWHGDWFGAWDPTAQAMWTDNCINKKLNCSGGDLGNAKGMKYSWPFSAYANPRLVPLTSVPYAATPSS